ncbi:hypothetical protein TcWFU_005169 [Taenia crassiceps]|uniref:Uncharacterized protein n=1 Tax=Taenia crassiceps TaxID=6207 RepID=A0ABR4QQL8_9CEST
MPQQVEGHIFPIHLEWLGGRNTFQQSNFSVRNAYICLEDMKDSDVIMPVELEKCGDRVIFRTNNETMEKDFDLSAIVLHAPGNEPLKQVHDFLFTRNFAQPPAPIQPRGENSPAISTSDTYEAPETGQPATNGVSTPEPQTEEGYEEVAVKLVEETINGHESSLASSEMGVPVQVKDEVAGEEVGKLRSSPSTTSVSSDTNLDKLQKEDILAKPVDDESDLRPQKLHEIEAPRTIEVSRPRHFGKLHLLTNIIAEEGIDTRHYHDDGRLYVVSWRAFRSSKCRSLSGGNSTAEDGTGSMNEGGEGCPVIKVQPIARSPTKYCQRQSRSPAKERHAQQRNRERSKGKSITPERPVCTRCIGSEGKKKLRNIPPTLRIRMQTSTCNVCECICSCNKNPTPILFCYSRRSHQPRCSNIHTLYVHSPS